jgi:hypothetical protein
VPDAALRGPYELRDTPLKEWPEAERQSYLRSATQALECLESATEYGELGYDQPKHGILFANWNYFSRGIGDLLERIGYSIEWEDEWCRCDNCGKALRTSPDSYSWQPSYIENIETGERYCHDCFTEDDIATFEDNPGRALNDHINPADYGYEKIEDGFESGWYPGQNANPKEIYARLVANGHKRILFVIDSTGQFDLRFSVWKKKTETN